MKKQKIKYAKQVLKFEARPKTTTKSIVGQKPAPVQTLDIEVMIGTEPIVTNLKALAKKAKTILTPEIELAFEKNDIYLIMHAIATARLKGRASVAEIQYKAEAIQPASFQTIDLFPSTKFKEVFKASANIEGALSASGKFSASLPPGIAQTLLSTVVPVGGDMKLQLSAKSELLAKFSWGIKIPKIQSTGIASKRCAWILQPDKNPLLGDHLLYQTIAVPIGTNKITFEIKAVVKAKGFFKKDQKPTSVHTIEVQLN